MRKNTNDKDYERLRLLCLNKKFYQTIRSYRLRWGLPENGCSDNERGLKWQSELTRRSGKEYFIKNNKISQNGDKFISINEFDIEIKKITKKFGFSDHFIEGIKNFVIFGIVSQDSKCTIQKQINLDTGMVTDLSIKIYPHTTIEDVRLVWPMVLHSQRHMSGYNRNKRNRATKNLDRDIRIFELYEQKYPSKEISKIINKEFGVKNLIYNEITRIVARLRKRINNSM